MRGDALRSEVFTSPASSRAFFTPARSLENAELNSRVDASTWVSPKHNISKISNEESEVVMR